MSLVCPFCGHCSNTIIHRRTAVTIEEHYDVVDCFLEEVKVRVDGVTDSFVEESGKTKSQWLCPHCRKDLYASKDPEYTIRID
jgi:ubiquitin C-terminal hydrolase